MKPVILLNCSIVEQPNIRYVEHANYVERITEAGGLPMLVPPLPSREEIKEALSLAHGMVLIGSSDFDPSLYGQERHEKTDIMHRRREKFDLELARLAYEMDIPILAICGGCQALSVALGGTLIQHIPDAIENALSHFKVEQEVPYHDVEIDRDSMLFSIVGVSPLRTNSYHHQALDKVPSELKVTARSADGVAEAYEDPSKRFCIAVQWHPERLGQEKEHMALFNAFVAAARQEK